MQVGFICLLALVLASTTAAGSTQAQYDAIRALGRLNGEALACRHLEQVRRMKAVVIANAPKERSFGLAFDEASNAGFLDFLEQGRPCPGGAALDARIDEATRTVVEAFRPRPASDP
jgi:hypothetical protein